MVVFALLLAESMPLPASHTRRVLVSGIGHIGRPQPCSGKLTWQRGRPPSPEGYRLPRVCRWRPLAGGCRTLCPLPFAADVPARCTRELSHSLLAGRPAAAAPEELFFSQEKSLSVFATSQRFLPLGSASPLEQRDGLCAQIYTSSGSVYAQVRSFAPPFLLSLLLAFRIALPATPRDLQACFRRRC